MYNVQYIAKKKGKHHLAIVGYEWLASSAVGDNSSRAAVNLQRQLARKEGTGHAEGKPTLRIL